MLERSSVPPIQAVVFDADGTLLTFSAPLGIQYARLLDRSGIDIPAEHLEKSIKQNWKRMKSLYLNEAGGYKTSVQQEYQFWQQFFHNVCLDAGCEAVSADVFQSVYQHFATLAARPLVQGVRTLLTVLRQRGLKTGVLSNHDQRIKKILEEAKVASLFELILTAEECGFKKPAPEAFLNFQERLGVVSGAILYVGNDFHIDYRGARSAGWQSVLVGTDTSWPSEVNSVRTLPDVLECISNRCD